MSGHPLPISLEAPALVSALIEALPDAVWLVNANNLRVVAANSAAGVLFMADPLELTGRHAQELCASPEDMAFWHEVGDAYLTADPQQVQIPSMESETLVRRFDGTTLPVLRKVRHIHLGPDQHFFLVAMQDRSEQQLMERALEEQLYELSAILDTSADGMMVTDCVGHIRNVNKQFAVLWGMPQELLLQRDDRAVLAWMREATADPLTYERELARIDDTTRLTFTDTITLINSRILEREATILRNGSRAIGRVFSFRDITQRITAQQRLDALSSTDPLTGLPNRCVLGERVAAALYRAQCDNTSFAVMVVNLDHFKHINDTLGHSFGDMVLVEMAERIKVCLRQFDTVARWGGDEFIVLVQQVDAKAAEATAQRVVQAMVRPFFLAGVHFDVTCSIGVALSPAHGASLEGLLSRANDALKDVKASGGAGHRLHQVQTPTGGAVQKRVHDGFFVEQAMRSGLAERRFELHYQPLVGVSTGRVTGAEALLRWNDPQLGSVSPLNFIPIAEESGFIVVLGDWVLQQAVQQAAIWRSQGRGLVVSVNVSAVQFHHPGFVGAVAAALEQAQLAPEWLDLELTESIFIQEASEPLDRLRSLSQMGVRLSIDDFGTGYSSLSYLKRLPMHRLKIDRSFLRGLPTDSSDVCIVNAVINLGHAMRMEVVAEGVETEIQRQFLQDAGCEHYQGFLFASAMDEKNFAACLDARALIQRVP